MTLEPLLWLHYSISGSCLLEYIIGTQSLAWLQGWRSANLCRRVFKVGVRLRGYLAHKKTLSPRNLSWAYA